MLSFWVYIVQRFDMEEACGQHCEESGKENVFALSAKTSRCYSSGPDHDIHKCRETCMQL